MLVGLFLLVFVSVAHAQQPPRVGISKDAAVMLADAWKKIPVFPNQDTYCAFGSQDTVAAVPVVFIESVTRATGPCSGAGLIGIIGFVDGNKYEAVDVTAGLARLLQQRPDLLILAEVHGLTRVFMDGEWITTPLVWAAIRG